MPIVTGTAIDCPPRPDRPGHNIDLPGGQSRNIANSADILPIGKAAADLLPIAKTSGQAASGAL